MKKLFTLIFLFGLVTACDTDDIAPVNERIAGEWVWIQSVGGIDGRTETPQSTQNEVYIVITENVLKKYENGNLDSQRTFSIVRGNSIYSEGEKDLLNFVDGGTTQSVEVIGNRLFLRDECLDCFQHEYVKK